MWSAPQFHIIVAESEFICIHSLTDRVFDRVRGYVKRTETENPVQFLQQLTRY